MERERGGGGMRKERMGGGEERGGEERGGEERGDKWGEEGEGETRERIYTSTTTNHPSDC